MADKDGYVNVRDARKANSQILDTIGNNHLVYCFETVDNWTSIDYLKEKQEKSGYVHKDRLKQISSYPNVPASKKNASYYEFEQNSVKVIVATLKFDTSKYKFSFYKEASDQIELINGKKYYGADGRIPGSEYKSIMVQSGSKTIYLPTIAIEDLFEPALDNTKVRYDKDNDIIYIQSANGNGDGSYDVIWRIEKGVYKDRCIGRRL